MPVAPFLLTGSPFRGSTAVADGLLTQRMLEGEQWRRLFRDVYVHGELPLTHAVWCDAAALLLPPGAAVSGWSALATWCPQWRVPPGSPVEVTLPRGITLRSRPMLRVRRSVLPAADATTLGGLPVTTPARTAADLARQAPLIRAVMATDALLARGVLDAGELHALAARPHLRDAAAVAEVAALARTGVESPMESATRVLLVRAGLPCPAVQHRVLDEGRFVARVDLAYPERRLAIEYDGDHHRDRTVSRADVKRLDALRLAGWTVLRFTADDVLHHPERVPVVVARALRATL